MPVLERCEERLVEGLGLVVAGGGEAHLRLEALALHVGVVELGEGVGDLHAAGEGLEALDQARLGAVALANGDSSTG